MASSLVARAARQAATVARLSSSPSAAQATSLVQRRGLAGAADHHGPPKVNVWQDPLSPSKWKEEHFVIVSLSGWGLLFFGGYKFFTGGKKNKEEVVFYDLETLSIRCYLFIQVCLGIICLSTLYVHMDKAFFRCSTLLLFFSPPL
ncbi:uncharacterized protein LOC131321963 isoform X1 [Rhododendron vialii]|uniref:uncharacterized protein LOC131321963 isoform X1 n=1 Tax=Rhododendron vialii TaxID=182163 RepID=UPI00266003DD|nr:uncharacterized protein LOC131321963 isoform X1 [Rhododendron vialii]